jgi:phospholipid transport system transporter-binding protein
MTAMLVFPAKIGHSEATSSMAWRADARASQYHIDLAALDVFDSSALSLLLDLRRAAISEGKELAIHNAPTKLTQLATLYGVNELIA